MPKMQSHQTRMTLLRILLKGFLPRHQASAKPQMLPQNTDEFRRYFSFTSSQDLPPLPPTKPRFTKPIKSLKLASELRNAPRRRVRLRSGKLANFTGRVLSDCLIHDKSLTGACVRLMNRAPLPLDFALYEEDIDCITPVRLVWRSGKSLGLCFIDSAASPTPDRLETLRQKLRRSFFNPQQ